jgi:hypothetical protein
MGQTIRADRSSGGGGGGAVDSFNGRTGTVVPQNGDYNTSQVTEIVNKKYVTDAEKLTIANTSGTNTGDETPLSVKTKYESNANTNAFTDTEKTKVNNLSGTNTGDETTSSIQAKRPIKTVNGQSLEGLGNVPISGFDPTTEGVLTDYSDNQSNNTQTTNSTSGVTYLTLSKTGVDLSSDYRFNVSFSISHNATNSNAFVDIKDFGVTILPQVYTVEPKDNSNRSWVTLSGRITPNTLGAGQIQLQLDFGTDDGGDSSTMYFANISLQKINE